MPEDDKSSDKDGAFISFHALLGILKVKEERFLGIVTEVEDLGLASKSCIRDICKVKKAQFLPFKSDLVLTAETKSVLDGIANLLQQGFYFSHCYDFTSSLQKNLRSPHKGDSLFSCANKDYAWNLHMAKKFPGSWVAPVIQGYVGVEEQQMLGRKFELLLISRRNHQRAGTRFNSRGIDKEGNVSNMVETEQILACDEHWCSHVQTRGSVPLFWRQKGVFHDVSMKRTAEENCEAAAKHFDALVKEYRAVLVFDLLADKKPSEAKLVKGYEEAVLAYQKATGANIKYCHFDFHRETAVTRKLRVEGRLEGGAGRSEHAAGDDKALRVLLQRGKGAAGNHKDQLLG